MSERVTMPLCPACGRYPILVFHQQAFCGSEDCPVLTWNVTMSISSVERGPDVTVDLRRRDDV